MTAEQAATLLRLWDKSEWSLAELSTIAGGMSKDRARRILKSGGVPLHPTSKGKGGKAGKLLVYRADVKLYMPALYESMAERVAEIRRAA